MLTTITENDLALLHNKIDRLTEQLDEQKRRRQATDELVQDLIPIANNTVKLTIDELAEVGTDFQAEDLLFMLKRLLRNTDTLLRLMDAVEAGIGLSDEMQILGKQVFGSTVATLDRLERDGYFAFLREGWRIVERIVAEFDERDVQALGDNIITILSTVRNLTQPETLALVNNALAAIGPSQAQEAQPVSALSLIRDLSDPQVRRGLARLLNLVRVLAAEPQSGGNGGFPGP